MTRTLLARARLATQKAMLGIVTPELRAVSVSQEGNIIFVCFFYEGEIFAELKALWQNALPQIQESLKNECKVELQIIRLDRPQKVPLKGWPGNGWFAYHRKE